MSGYAPFQSTLLLTLKVLVTGCASSQQSRGGEVARLQEDNRKLRAQFGAQLGEAQQAFDSASQEEKQAQVPAASCAQMSSTSAPAPATAAPRQVLGVTTTQTHVAVVYR